ncbi:MAG: mammalian cell entry protein, partial [Luteibacter jiangsuensis]
MSDTNVGSTPPDDDLPQPVVRKSKLGFSLIWLVPIVAALVGISLLVSHFMSAGPQITVSFLT